MDKDVFILCGGQGTRLRSVIGETQKVLAEVNGVPFLDFILSRLEKQQVKRVVLCAGFQANAIKAQYRKSRFPFDIELSIEDEPLGTGGAIKQAQSFLKTKDFIVLNGDSYCDVSLRSLAIFHEDARALASMVVAAKNDIKDYGVVFINHLNEIISFEEKSGRDAKFVNAGVYCFSSDIFSHFPEENVFSLEKNFFPQIVGKKFYGMPTFKSFWDIGTPDRFEQANEELNTNH